VTFNFVEVVAQPTVGFECHHAFFVCPATINFVDVVQSSQSKHDTYNKRRHTWLTIRNGRSCVAASESSFQIG